MLMVGGIIFFIIGCIYLVLDATVMGDKVNGIAAGCFFIAAAVCFK